MTLKKKLIATAVGGTLSLGLGMPSAQASHFYLFPYVVKDTNRTTIVTLIGDGNPVNAGASIHLQYWTKSTTDANTAACQPSSTAITFTDNDIVTFDTAALLGAGPLFGDTTNNAPLGTSISYAAPRHGYLLAEWLTDFAEAGYWVEIDLANGGAHGDKALRGAVGDSFNIGPGMSTGTVLDAVNTTTSAFNSLHVGDTTSIGGWSDGFGVVRVAHAVTFWPTSVASTAFTVTPLGTAMNTVENNQSILQVLNDQDVQGAYDRNENGIDGTVRQTVRCVGRPTAAQLMPGVVSNAAWAATGGWGFLANLGDGDTNYTEGGTQDLRAAVYQVDTSSAAGAGKFMQNATSITSLDY